MGYTTNFSGHFQTNEPVSQEIYDLVNGLSKTRRMKRDGLSREKYGVKGEFFIEEEKGNNIFSKPSKGTIVDHNKPPKTQPGLWLQWMFEEDMQTIVWDGGEKFYNYIEWIEYLIIRILEPAGYKVNGQVEWNGEDIGDIGTIRIIDNKIIVKEGVV